MNDLIILVADKDAEFTIKGLLSRHHALSIRNIVPRTSIFTHENWDNGCYTGAHEFLRSFSSRYRHALVIFDHHGSGHENISRIDVEQEIEERLSKNGWEDRAAAIVIEPELEAWVWTQSPHVEDVLGWRGREPALYSWLRSEGYINNITQKPSDPKSALRQALRIATKRSSPSVFFDLAQKVSFAQCQDQAFSKLRDTLQRWFGSTIASHL